MALHGPRNTFHYKNEDDLLVLAVQLGVEIARNHGFVDGNKRTGVVAMIAFLNANGYALRMRNDRLSAGCSKACWCGRQAKRTWSRRCIPALWRSRSSFIHIGAGLAS